MDGKPRRDSQFSLLSDASFPVGFSNYTSSFDEPLNSLIPQAESSMSQDVQDSAFPPSLFNFPQQSPALHLETFFFQRFITSVWLHSQADAWRHHLPVVLNESPALYYSVMGLSALYMARTGTNPGAVGSALSLYQGALGHLQQALWDPGQAYEDSTLMATMIIGLYELIDKPSLASWSSHSRGTAELMRLRGSEAVRSGVGRMLFLTFRGFEVLRAITQREETFLTDPEWTVKSSNRATIEASGGLLSLSLDEQQARMKTANAYGLDNDRDDDDGSVDYSAVLFMLGAQTASFQATCQRRFNAREMTGTVPTELLTEARIIESNLKKWLALLPDSYAPMEVRVAPPPHSSSPKMSSSSSSSSSSSCSSRSSSLMRTNAVPPYPVDYDYNSFLIGYQRCFQSAFLLLLHKTMAKYILRDVSRIPQTDQELARSIVKSANFLTRGKTTASLNVTWPIFMASMSLRDPGEKQWAMGLLLVICREKGWAVANSALNAAMAGMQRSLARVSTNGNNGKPGGGRDKKQ